MNFWEMLERPIIGLSPMDGVTDAPFRFITAKVGRPDVIFTEFVAVEGLVRSLAPLLNDFIFHEIERPVVAQIFGPDPASFYKVAHLVCELGFDGIDINMGCPAKKVADRGAGAGLILDPTRAKKIIHETKRGVAHWAEGQSLEKLGFESEFIKIIKKRRAALPEFHQERRDSIPVSVKTRIGYDKVVIEDWVNHLLEEEPKVISIHGRTLKQMYRGSADWDSIGRAAQIIKKTKTLVLGNGDINSKEQIKKRLEETNLDGVLIGRSAIGNPWIFSPSSLEGEVPKSVRLEVLLEHVKVFEQLRGTRQFSKLNRFFKSYASGFSGVGELRKKLYESKSTKEVEGLLKNFRC